MDIGDNPRRMDDKNLLKTLKYINYLKEGHKPRFPNEAIRHLSKYLNEIEKISAKEGFDITVGLDMPDGNRVDVHLLKDSSYAFHYLLPVIFEKNISQKVGQYFEITTQFLTSNNIDTALKAQLIDCEYENLAVELEGNYSSNPSGFKALEARLAFCKVALASKDVGFENKKPLEQAYSSYLQKSLNVLVDSGKLLQGLDFLQALYDNSSSTNENRCIVRSIISHGTSFNLISRTELDSLLDDHEDDYEPQEIPLMRAAIATDPSTMHVSNFSTSNGNLSLKSTENKDITTLISFSIPNACYMSEERIMDIDEKTQIILSPVAAFWADPMFKPMRNFKIANMGWSHFCDVEPKEGKNYTHVKIAIKELFVPDVLLTKDSNDSIDFSDKEALMGRRFYPHKEFVIKAFLNIFDEISKELEIEKKDININLFSNYFVQHIDNETGENIHFKLFAITNPDSYSKTTTKFLERLQSINLSDSLVNIRDLLTSTKIETEKTLMEFVNRSIDLVVKHNIENHGGYKYFWKSDGNGGLKPCREAEAQPYIFSHLKSIFDFMGIQISREVESSNGEIDFLVTYTNSQRKLLRLCVELKLAQAAKVENGLTKQLPAYMKGEKCKYGIYVVLWFKSENYEEPKKYIGIQDLQSSLDEINSNHKILSMIIDCSKPTSPSKLK